MMTGALEILMPFLQTLGVQCARQVARGFPHPLPQLQTAASSILPPSSILYLYCRPPHLFSPRKIPMYYTSIDFTMTNAQMEGIAAPRLLSPPKIPASQCFHPRTGQHPPLSVVKAGLLSGILLPSPTRKLKKTKQ